MKKTIPEIRYARLYLLFQKLQARLNRNIGQGRFIHFTQKQRVRLLNRLQKIKTQLQQLAQGMKWTGAALAMGITGIALQSEAQLLPAGTEFKVNTATAWNQRNASIAIDTDGDFIIAWESPTDEYTTYTDIFVQRYNAAGVAQGAPVVVNSAGSEDQSHPAVGLNDDGSFVIAYDRYQYEPDNRNIYVRRYDAAGVAVGAEVMVSSNTEVIQRNPVIAVDSDGDFVVSWEAYQDGDKFGIYARRFNASAAAQGAEFRVNTYTTDNQLNQAVAMDDAGNFVITWQSYEQDGNDFGVYAQRYNAAGAPQGGEFRVNTSTENQQQHPAIAMDADGDFIIAWETSTGYYDVYLQRYNAAGVAQGTEFSANIEEAYGGFRPALAMDSDGDFVLTWQTFIDYDSYLDVYAKRYTAAGAAIGTEIRVNTHTNNYQENSIVALDEEGDIVVVWESEDQDGSGRGIYAQRYTVEDLTTSARKNTSASLFNMYPNPAKEQVHLSVEPGAYVKITDLSGHTVKEQYLTGNTIDIAGFTAGIYLVTVNSGGQEEIKKLVVE